MKRKKNSGKRVLSSVLAVLMVLSLIPLSVFNVFADCECSLNEYENGFCNECGGFEPATYNAEKGVYEISNAGQLYWFADRVKNDNANFKYVKVILTNDIVVNDGVITAETIGAKEWMPIGDSSQSYAGTFDGQNYSVSGIYCNMPEKRNVGFFGYTDNSVVKNLTIKNSYFCGNTNVGGIVGNNFGTISNCHNFSTVEGWTSVGGILGYTGESGIVECSNNGTISGYMGVGGIGGSIANMAAMYCFNSGTITGESEVGGIAGDRFEATVIACCNIGSVIGTEYTGGIIGFEEGDWLQSCYYLDTSCSGAIQGEDVEGKAEARTLAQFKSGEVAYLLQAGVEPEEIYDDDWNYIETITRQIWGQQIGTDDYPVIYGDKVYKVTDCKGNYIYSNKDGNGQHNYIDGQCEKCGAAKPVDKVTGYNISLGDKLAVNYYIELSEETLNNPEAKIVFEVPDSGSTYKLEIPVKDGVEQSEGSGIYIFTCKVAAKEMTSTIKGKLVTGDAEIKLSDYSVYKYANVILQNPEQYPGAQSLIKAMLNYGAQAQLYFNYNSDELANDNEFMTEEDKKTELYDFSDATYSLEGSENGVVYYGSALSLESELAFKHYFIVDDSVDVESLEITCDYPTSLKKNGSCYELIISDIPAHMMGADSIKVTIGGLTLDYTIYSYGALVQKSGNTNLHKLLSALVTFAEEAYAY